MSKGLAGHLGEHHFIQKQNGGLNVGRSFRIQLNIYIFQHITPGIWRRLRDSNPGRTFTLVGFQDRCIRPLCQTSNTGASRHFKCRSKDQTRTVGAKLSREEIRAVWTHSTFNSCNPPLSFAAVVARGIKYPLRQGHGPRERIIQEPEKPDLRATGAHIMQKILSSRRWLSGTVAAVAMVSLSACEQIEAMDIENPFAGFFDSSENSGDAAAPSLASGDVETRDVEAPDVFQKTEAGLWDGRPSLGGVWVAHPDVVDPERVIIRNEDNGRFIVGALFRRERENPGPALQVSSDAAEELGMLAGAPANLDVVALRREEVEVPAAPVLSDAPPVEGLASDALPAADLSAPVDVTATPLDLPAVEVPAASVPAVDVPAVDLPLPSVAQSGVLAGAAAAVAAAEQAANAGIAVTAPPAPVIPVTEEADVSSTLPPLNALTPESPLGNPPLPTAEAPIAAPAAPIAASSLEKPFIQIGIFSVEANAEETANKLRADGTSARVLKQESQGTTFWRVLVGPAPNAQDRTAVLAKVQALGFNDAYFVTN